MIKTVLKMFFVLFLSLLSMAIMDNHSASAATPEATIFPSNQESETCIDSDSGVNYFTKGYVDTKSNGSIGHYNDLCWNGTDELREWSCKGTSPFETKYICPNGCSNGACIKKNTGKPDLIVESIIIEPENAQSAEQICVYATIKNTGSKAIDNNTITAWTYINENHISNMYFGKSLAANEKIKKQVLCSKYGENISFKIGKNIVKVDVDPAAINIIDESNENNNEATSNFNIVQSNALQDTDWDIAIMFDNADKNPFFPFSNEAGTIKTEYKTKLDQTDNLYKEVSYRETCGSYYYTNDTASKRATGWFAERKKISEGQYIVLIKGNAAADCNYSKTGYVSGEFRINISGKWRIRNVISCSASSSNKGQSTYCIADSRGVKFAAGSTCGGCCACADSAGINIELLLDNSGEPETNPNYSANISPVPHSALLATPKPTPYVFNTPEPDKSAQSDKTSPDSTNDVFIIVSFFLIVIMACTIAFIAANKNKESSNALKTKEKICLKCGKNFESDANKCPFCGSENLFTKE